MRFKMDVIIKCNELILCRKLFSSSYIPWKVVVTHHFSGLKQRTLFLYHRFLSTF